MLLVWFTSVGHSLNRAPRGTVFRSDRNQCHAAGVGHRCVWSLLTRRLFEDVLLRCGAILQTNDQAGTLRWDGTGAVRDEAIGYKHKRGIETLSIRPITVLIGVNDLLAGL